MSDTVKLKLQSVKGVVERVNPRGLKVAGTWYDYHPSFPENERPGAEAIGQEVELALAESKSGKPFIRSFEISDGIAGDPGDGDAQPAEATAPEGPSPGEDCASPKQVKFIGTLLEKEGLTDDDLEGMTQIRFKKAFADLTKREASRTIQYLGGENSANRARQSN